MKYIFHTVLGHMGCRIELTELAEPDFTLVDDGKWHGSFKRLASGEADAVMRYLWLTHNRTADFDPSVSLFLETLYVYVTKSGVEPGHSLLLEAVIVLASLGTVAVNHWLDIARHRVRRDARAGGNLGVLLAVQSAWSLFTDQPSSAGRLSPSWNRLLWASLAFAAVTLNSMRKSVYATNAMWPTSTRMHNFTELLQLGVPMGVQDSVLLNVLTDTEVLHAARTKRRKAFLPPREDCSTNTTACLQRLEDSRGRFAMVLNQAALENVTLDLRSKMWPLSPPLMVTPIVAYFAKDHPLVENFSSHVQQMHAGGVILHNFRKELRKTHRWPGAGSRRGGPPQPLRLKDLAHVLRIVVKFAMPLPFLCFIAELLIWRTCSY